MLFRSRFSHPLVRTSDAASAFGSLLGAFPPFSSPRRKYCIRRFCVLELCPGRDGAWLFPFLPLQHCALGRQLIELPGTGINLCSCRHSGISVSGNRDLRLNLMLLGERGLLATSVLMVTVAHDPMIDPDTRFSGSFALTRKWVQSLTTPHLSTMRSYRFLVRLMASLWACVSMFFCESQCASRIMAAFKLRSDSSGSGMAR